MIRRTNLKDKNTGKVKYKKIGGGTFRLKDGKIVKPNETFWAFPADIPEAFKDTLEVLTDIPKEAKPVKEPVKSTFTLEPKGVGWWNVVDIDGKVMNEKALRKPEAEELLTQLSAE